jgi:hypothetical protein
MIMSIQLRPSKAHRWVHCAASPSLQSKYPSDFVTSDAAEEGTAAHFVASQLLKGEPAALGSFTPNQIAVDQDMIDAAEKYKVIVESWRTPFIAEEYLKIPDIPAVVGGTPDLWSIDPENKLIRIMDYKYGFNSIEAFQNWQMLCYFSGIASALKLTKPEDWGVEFNIFQPRGYHSEGVHRTWQTSFATAKEKVLVLKEAALKTQDHTTVATVGTHCLNCEARHACTTLQQSNFIAIALSKEANAFNLTTQQAGAELSQIDHALEILKARKTGLEAQLMHAIAQGEMSQHYTVERVKSREKWKEGSEQSIITIGQILGKNLSAPAKAISPAQCRKLHIDENIIKEYSIAPLGENKLVRLNTIKSQKLFGK